MPAVTQFAHRVGAVSHPRADRHSSRPVPTLGGLAIALAVAVGVVLSGLSAADTGGFLFGLGAMVALGLADDLAFVSPRSRVIAEALVGIIFMIVVTDGLDVALRTAAVAVGAVGFPVAMNATNLVDNADGLAGSLSLVTALTLAAITGMLGVESGGGTIALVVAAALLGFLLYNLPPARVFMGDSGSLMLGFALAASSTLIVRDALGLPGDIHKTAALIVPLAWAVQLGDIAMVFTTRLRRGASPFRGGVDHTSHRLLAAGLSPWQMLALLAFAGTLLAAIGVAVVLLSGDFRVVAGTGVVLGVLVGLFEMYVAVRLPAPGPARPPSLDDDRREIVRQAAADGALPHRLLGTRGAHRR